MRTGKPIKNKKRRDPRYFLHEDVDDPDYLSPEERSKMVAAAKADVEGSLAKKQSGAQQGDPDSNADDAAELRDIANDLETSAGSGEGAEGSGRPTLDTMGLDPEVEMPDGTSLTIRDIHKEMVESGAVVEWEGEEINFATNEYVRGEEYPEDHGFALAEMFLLHKGYDPDDEASVARKP